MSESDSSQDDTTDPVDPDPNTPGAADEEQQEGTTVSPESAGPDADSGQTDPFEDPGAYAQASQSSQDRGHEEGDFGRGTGSEESHHPGASGEQEKRGG